MHGLLRRGGGLAALVTLLVCADASATSFAPPVLVHGTQAHRETSLAINPKNERQMLVCDPSGVPNTTYNQSYFHLTEDGGATWKPIDVEGCGETPA